MNVLGNFKPYKMIGKQDNFDYLVSGRNEEIASKNDGTMVTVIVVTYNHEAYIAEALDSIVNQKTNFKFKVFVGEDCGPDKTAEIVLKYAEQYPDIIIPFIRQKNMGSKRNMVDLIQHATSPFICFCDGDDYWIDEYKLQKQFDYMEEYPSVRACFGRTRIDAPADWYLNNNFKPNEKGERILPDSIPGYRDHHRLLDATDIIKYHPMHTVTVFYRWNYNIGFPDWFFYGSLGDIPLSLLQIGNGKVKFFSEIMGVYRRTDVGIYMFSDRDNHFLETRGDYINYISGIRKDFNYRFDTFAKEAIENRIKLEWHNLLNVALKCHRMDKIDEMIRNFPETAEIAFATYKIFYEDGCRMCGKYGISAYNLLAKNRFFIHSFAPFIKIVTYLYNKIHTLFHINWIKKIARAPFTLFIDKRLPGAVLEAYNTKADRIYSEMSCHKDWNDFINNAVGSKVVFVGFGPGVWECLEYLQDMVIPLCIIGFGEERTIYKKIPLIDWVQFDKNTLPEDAIFLLTDSHVTRLSAAIQFMQDNKIETYYCWAYMRGEQLKYKKYKKLYDIKYQQKQIWVKNGLFRNIFLFNVKGFFREKHIGFHWKKFEKLKEFYHIHSGETCYIVGTGPSLTQSDIEMIRNKITFSVNGIYKMFCNTDWRPTYYAICDPNAIYEALKYLKTKQESIKIEEIDWDSFALSAIFMPDSITRLLQYNPFMKKSFFVAYSYLNQHIDPCYTMFQYNDDIVKGSYNLRTVVNFCINLAHYMGFKRIVLLGVDCNYTGEYQYFDGSKNIHVTDQRSRNKPYYAIVTQKEMVRAYEYINVIAKKNGIEIVNATRGGALEVFERVNLEDEVLR